jgi:cytochrome c biogenesis protein CcdA
LQEPAGFSLAIAFFAVGAGLASIASPCVLPFLPIVMAGPPGESRLRPVAIVAGLMSTFVPMGVLLGASLGLVWIPCVGPFPSAILGMVAARAQVGEAVVLLVFYSLGFALPMPVAGYASQLFREKTAFLKTRPLAVRLASGALLVGLSVWILAKGLYSTPW